MEKISTSNQSKAVRIFDIGHPELLEKIAREMKFRAENANPGEIVTHELVEGIVLSYNPSQKSVDMIAARSAAVSTLGRFDPATEPAGHS
jgi:dihydroxyacetone kinase DhaKLM complex PTS-EIIA-like component DhaM